MSCSRGIEPKLCKVKIFQLQSMSHVIIFINKSLLKGLCHGAATNFVVKNSGRLPPWYSTWAIREQQSCMQKNLNGSKLLDVTSHIQFSSINQYKPMAQWSRRVAVSRITWVWNSHDDEPTSWPFCMALSISLHWHTRFYIAALSIFFFFLGFCKWWSYTDRILTLNMNIRLPLYGALGEGPWARPQQYLLAWAWAWL